MIIRLGGYDFAHTDENLPFLDSSVKTVKIHPNFDAVTFENDLALIRLARPVQLAPNIVPICLAPAKDYTKLYATVSGWGTTSYSK